ncbi:MAG: outer membrane lipoprotein carrier protein LolA, partial [Bryobacteraceae bacterium]
MKFALLTLTAAAWLFVPASAPAETLQDVLARMDQGAKGFKCMVADLKRVTHTAVLNDNSEDTGKVRMKRFGSRDLRIAIDFISPDQSTVVFRGQKVEKYFPKIKTIQVYDLGKQRQLVDQFLLLGFGTSSKELSSGYDIKFLGADRANGQSAWHLELIPKSAQAREHIKTVDLWISAANGQPVQQKFLEPSGDYNLIAYSNVQLDVNIS